MSNLGPLAASGAGAVSASSFSAASSGAARSTRNFCSGPRASFESGSEASSTASSAMLAGASKRTWTTPASAGRAPTTLTWAGSHFVASATASANSLLKLVGNGPFTRRLRRACSSTAFSLAASLVSRTFIFATMASSEAPPASATRFTLEITTDEPAVVAFCAATRRGAVAAGAVVLARAWATGAASSSSSLLCLWWRRWWW
mmetsp:Transcript_37969/g.98259  ORF Transcript_37969/g.98259 Transcript_37969/m.98259 type:complete len:203 (+) Transcript_37969:439-1047(+)